MHFISTNKRCLGSYLIPWPLPHTPQHTNIQTHILQVMRLWVLSWFISFYFQAWETAVANFFLWVFSSICEECLGDFCSCSCLLLQFSLVLIISLKLSGGCSWLQKGNSDFIGGVMHALGTFSKWSNLFQNLVLCVFCFTKSLLMCIFEV